MVNLNIIFRVGKYVKAKRPVTALILTKFH